MIVPEPNVKDYPDLIDRTVLCDRINQLRTLGSSSTVEFVDAMQTAIRALDSTPVGITTTTVIDTKPDYTITYGTHKPEDERILFVCPYCGTHFLARDPGFIPNCHNCNGVMRIAKGTQEETG